MKHPNLNKAPEMALIVLYALRYCLPSHSLAPSYMGDFLRRNWRHPALATQKNRMKADIAEYLRDCPPRDAMEQNDWLAWHDLLQELCKLDKEKN